MVKRHYICLATILLTLPDAVCNHVKRRIPWPYSRMTMLRFIRLKLWMRAQGIIFTHDFNPIESLWLFHIFKIISSSLSSLVWKDLKTLQSGLTPPMSIHNLGQKWTQLLMEINVVTLHEVVETMPRWIHTVIKAKGGSTKYYWVRLFFWSMTNQSIYS